MDPIQEFSKSKLTLDNCIIPNERLRNTPSSKDGCSHDLEVDLRIVGCEYIQTAGVLLRLPQVAMATAQILFQRYFYSKSLVKYNMLHVAMATLFLAAKIEENCRRVRDIANVFHHLKQKRMGRPVVPMEYMGEEYFKLKASIIKYERFVLKDLGFCVHVKHPHKLIISYLKILELEMNSQLAQKSWNYMNDSLRTNVFVRFPPETIACACIFLSARQLKIGLPQKPPWWTVFDILFEDIEAISLDILGLYNRPRAFLVDLDKQLGVLKEELAKKQVEIKEVNLKKVATKSTAESSAVPTPGTNGLEKTSNTSPGIPPTSKSNLLSSSQNNSQRRSLSPSTPHPPPPLPVTNGNRTNKSITPVKPGKRQHHQSTPSPHLTTKKRKLSHSPSQSPIPEKNHRHDKPVISPIRVVASSGESYSDGSGSPLPPPPPPPAPRENGIPEQYRVDFSKHTSSKHHRHHHHRHHHRSTSKSHQERHHHRHHRHQQQWEMGAKKETDRHVRRTASDRHR